MQTQNLDNLRFVLNNRTGQIVFDIENFQAQLDFTSTSIEVSDLEHQNYQLDRTCILTDRKIDFLQKHTLKNPSDMQYISIAIIKNKVFALDRGLHLTVSQVFSDPYLGMRILQGYPVNLNEKFGLGVNFNTKKDYSKLLAHESSNTIFYVTENSTFALTNFESAAEIQVKQSQNYVPRKLYNVYIQGDDKMIVAGGTGGVDIYAISNDELFNHTNYPGQLLFSFLDRGEMFEISDVQRDDNVLFVLDINWGLAIYKIDEFDQSIERLSMYIPPKYDGRMTNIKQLGKRIVFITEEVDVITYYLHEIFIDTSSEQFYFNNELLVGLKFDEIELNNDIAIIISSKIHYGFFHGTFSQFVHDFRSVGIHFTSDIQSIQRVNYQIPGKPIKLYASQAGVNIKLIEIQYYPYQLLCLADESLPYGNINYNLRMNSTRCSQQRQHFNFFQQCQVNQNITIVNAAIVKKGATVFSQSQFRNILIVLSFTFTAIILVFCLIFLGWKRYQNKAHQMETQLKTLQTKYNRLTGVADDVESSQDSKD